MTNTKVSVGDEVIVKAAIVEPQRDGSSLTFDRTAIVREEANEAGMVRVEYTSHLDRFGRMGWARATSISPVA